MAPDMGPRYLEGDHKDSILGERRSIAEGLEALSFWGPLPVVRLLFRSCWGRDGCGDTEGPSWSLRHSAGLLLRNLNQISITWIYGK